MGFIKKSLKFIIESCLTKEFFEKLKLIGQLFKKIKFLFFKYFLKYSFSRSNVVLNKRRIAQAS